MPAGKSLRMRLCAMDRRRREVRMFAAAMQHPITITGDNP